MGKGEHSPSSGHGPGAFHKASQPKALAEAFGNFQEQKPQTEQHLSVWSERDQCCVSREATSQGSLCFQLM